MSALKIATRENRISFYPGEEITGAAAWQLDEAPKAVELRLFWFTRGKGTSDVNVVQTLRFENAGLEEARPFQFRLPAEPYSFSGRLISLIWALELVIEPGKQVERLEIVVSPTGEEVLLNKSSGGAAATPARRDGTHG